MATNQTLAESYQAVRRRCIEIGRGLDDAQSATMSPCCPAWSVKDLFAHLVGVPVDVLEGNIEHAATAPWADAHVTRRADDSLHRILDEWETTAEPMDGLLSGVATDIDPRFFLDCWTHEWDLRQALGIAAVPDLTIPEYVLSMVGTTLTERTRENESRGAVVLHVDTPNGVVDVTVGEGELIADGSMSLFELMRTIVGRRSRSQIAAIGADLPPDRLVYFEANSADIIDPVLVG